MNFQHIQYSIAAPYIACIQLNRPDAANALNTKLAEEFADALEQVAADNQIRALIVTGAGERAFCAGADLKERAGMDKAAWDAQHHAFESAFAALAALEIPTIAAVNGAAYAGGLELALACDLIVAAPHAKFALTEATLGIMPGLGGTQRLPRAIGERSALEMLLTGTPINAEKAITLGMINSIHQDVVKEARNLAEKIAAAAPLSTRAIKKAVRRGSELPLKDALAFELIHYASLIETEDRIEGNQAFIEKRKPLFTGN